MSGGDDWGRRERGGDIMFMGSMPIEEEHNLSWDNCDEDRSHN